VRVRERRGGGKLYDFEKGSEESGGVPTRGASGELIDLHADDPYEQAGGRYSVPQPRQPARRQARPMFRDQEHFPTLGR
jgi:hypothetical protein